MSAPVCVCTGEAVQMRCEKNGIMVFNKEVSEPDHMRTHSGDKFTCPVCGNSVIVGFSATFYCSELTVARAIEWGDGIYGDV